VPGWQCRICDCGRTFGSLEAALAHQIEDHAPHECRVCGTVVPEGLLAIAHAFDEHTRADYVRHYDGDADAIRRREALLGEVRERADLDALRERLDADTTAARAD
jgi:hypothetical protein